MSEFLARFHRVLVHEIRKSKPEYLETRFTVAEIYQNLVPYRTHRDAIGVEMNGDYEATLLRLLAGEGDFLMIESEVARREIREELQSSNPNTGLFRDFAAADVRLTSAHRDVPEEDVEGSAEESVGETAGGADDQPATADLADLLAEASSGVDAPPEDGGAKGVGLSGDYAEQYEVDITGEAHDEADGEAPGDGNDAGDQPEGDLIAGNHTEEDAAEEDAAEDDENAADEAVSSGDGEEPSAEGGAEVCQWCRADLPERSVVNYCPFCGSDLRLTPCAKCGEELEPGWRFCPGCGTES